MDFKQKNNQICIDVKKCAKICTKNKKIWKYKDWLCYNEVSQKELFIQEEVRGWYHLPISSKINLEYMQGM